MRHSCPLLSDKMEGNLELVNYGAFSADLHGRQAGKPAGKNGTER